MPASAPSHARSLNVSTPRDDRSEAWIQYGAPHQAMEAYSLQVPTSLPDLLLRWHAEVAC